MNRFVVFTAKTSPKWRTLPFPMMTTSTTIVRMTRDMRQHRSRTHRLHRTNTKIRSRRQYSRQLGRRFSTNSAASAALTKWTTWTWRPNRRFAPDPSRRSRAAEATARVVRAARRADAGHAQGESSIDNLQKSGSLSRKPHTFPQIIDLACK